MEMFNMRHLGGGMSRKAFTHPVHPDLVVKVAKSERGQVDNLSEAQVWSTAGDELKKFLAPIYSVAENGEWQVMHRVTPISNLNYLASKVWHLRAEQGALDLKLPVELQWDTHQGNLGVLDNRVVLLDYGLVGGSSESLSCELEECKNTLRSLFKRRTEYIEEVILDRRGLTY